MSSLILSGEDSEYDKSVVLMVFNNHALKILYIFSKYKKIHLM